MTEDCRTLFTERFAGWKIICTVLVVHIIQSTAINMVVFPSKMLLPLQASTGGLLNSTLQANLISMLIVLPIIFVGGRLRLNDLSLTPLLGVESTTLFKGFVWTCVALLLIHVAGLIAIACGFGSLSLNPEIANGPMSQPAIRALGFCFSQFAGNAFYEELLFRAFLIPQLLLGLASWKPMWSWRKCFWVSLLLSQIIFSLQHIPNRIYRGDYVDATAVVTDLTMLFFAGLLFAAVFLGTRNIYAAIGVHSIVNYPPTLFEIPIGGLQFVAYFVIIVAVGWNFLLRRRRT